MDKITHVFVELIPEVIPNRVLYISIKYSVAIHNCVCGCGNKVVTPLSPVAWQLNYDGESVSLSPSIGNWSFKCQSHYWIVNDAIEYSTKWSQARIDKGREEEIRRKDQYYKNKKQ